MLLGFDKHTFNLAAAIDELGEFKRLLDDNQALKERDQVLHSFDRWPNLCLMFGKFNLKVDIGDHYRRELSVANLMRADLGVTRAGSDAMCLVEFEGASPNCMFKPFTPGTNSKGKKRRPRQAAEWAEPFEKGFSQIVDWAWAIDTHRQSTEMVDAFGSDRTDCTGVLVIGRDTGLTAKTSQDRWKWRGKHVTVANWPVSLMTYDEVYRNFDAALKLRQADAQAASQGNSASGDGTPC